MREHQQQSGTILGIPSKRQDSQGVTPLKMGDGILHSDTKTKTTELFPSSVSNSCKLLDHIIHSQL